jgi:hypothetical protein
MEDIGTGAGLGALGFWLFIASVIAVGVWYDIRRREAQHETLRRIVESGQPIDEAVIDKVLALTSGNRDLARDLKISGLIMVFIAPGLIVLGWLLSAAGEENLLLIMLGVAALVAFIAAGLLIASRVARKWRDAPDGSAVV